MLKAVLSMTIVCLVSVFRLVEIDQTLKSELYLLPTKLNSYEEFALVIGAKASKVDDYMELAAQENGTNTIYKLYIMYRKGQKKYSETQRRPSCLDVY